MLLVYRLSAIEDIFCFALSVRMASSFRCFRHLVHFQDTSTSLGFCIKFIEQGQP